MGGILVALGGGLVFGLEARQRRQQLAVAASSEPIAEVAPARATPDVAEAPSRQAAPEPPPDPYAAAPASPPLPEVQEPGNPAAKAEQAPPDVERLMAETPITMYTTTWCGVCKKARAFLQQNNVRFQEYDIEANEAARSRAAKLNPQLSVPTIDIDGEVEIGFSPQGFASIWSSALSRRAGQRVDIVLR